MKAVTVAALAVLAQSNAAHTLKRLPEQRPKPDVSVTLQNILGNTHGSDLYTYPTDLTRGIVPKPIHSHNDYWRDVPFFTGLSYGCISTEADVWLYNSTLHVGHEQSALTKARTFSALYVEPILSVLRRENPDSIFISGPTHNGVFDTDAGQTLYLFVDVKTDGASTFPYVVQALDPLRKAGFLTTYNASNEPVITHGAVTVIGTGNTPLSQIAPLSYRDYFFDADLSLLSSSQSDLTPEVAPIASAPFSRHIGRVNGTHLNDTQLQILQNQVDLARSKGIGARYWDTPAWPISTRNAIWEQLVRAGVALLNADDLAAAAGFSGQTW